MRGLVCVLFLGALLGLGCENLPRLWDTSKTTSRPAPAAAVATALRPLVMPEQVHEGNAREVATQLLEEMDREAEGVPAGAGESPASPSKPAHK